MRFPKAFSRAFWTITVGVALLSFSGSALVTFKAQQFKAQHRRPSSASWVEIFKAPRDMARAVDAIAVARAVDVEPGRLVYSPNGKVAVPFEVVTFEVVTPLKGVEPGESLSVERVASGSAGVFDADGGPYEKGSLYLLFLREQKNGPYFYLVNDEGRYEVVKGRLRRTATQGDVAAFFHGRHLADAATWVEQSLKAAGPTRQ